MADPSGLDFQDQLRAQQEALSNESLDQHRAERKCIIDGNPTQEGRDLCDTCQARLDNYTKEKENG